jgi:hypothetical protein
MRQFGVWIDTLTKLRDPPVPDQRMARVNPSAPSRLDEGIKDLFDYACISSDLDAAADLLTLMEKWLTRHSHGDEQQRRNRAILIRRMQGELNRRHIAKGSRPPYGTEEK